MNLLNKSSLKLEIMKLKNGYRKLSGIGATNVRVRA